MKNTPKNNFTSSLLTAVKESNMFDKKELVQKTIISSQIQRTGDHCWVITTAGREHDGHLYVGEFFVEDDGQVDFTKPALISLDISGTIINYKSIPNLNDIPLPILRELNVTIWFEGLRLVSFNLPDGTPYGCVWDFVNRSDLVSLRNTDTFQFLYPERTTFLDSDFISSPNNTITKTFTYIKTDNFSYKEGVVPTPRLGAIYTYVPDDDFYLVLGGIIAIKRSDYKLFNRAVEYLDSLKMFLKTPREEIKNLVENCFYESNEIWKYQISQGSWKLVFRETYGLPPMTSSDFFGFFHLERKKVYYMSSHNIFDNLLYEYDYHKNQFRKIRWWKFAPVPDPGEIDPCIDYSNDTLLIPATYGHLIFVFCFKTNRTFCVLLEDVVYTTSWSKWRRKKKETRTTFPNIITYPEWKVRLFNDFNTLVFLPGYRETTMIKIDWGYLKRNNLNPKLEIWRKACCKGQKKKIESIPSSSSKTEECMNKG